MPGIEFILLRLIFWVGLPLLLTVLAIGPAKTKRLLARGWHWLFDKRLSPDEILAQVLSQHKAHLAALRESLSQAEKTEQGIGQNIERSQKNLKKLDAELQNPQAATDKLARVAAEYKQNLERAALVTFTDQQQQQHALIVEAQRRLYAAELQLRQYEVGRNILLSQLAEAKNVEQQYAVVSRFDPFNALADWRRAEDLVVDQTLRAKALERVHDDLLRMIDGAAPPAAKAQTKNATKTSPSKIIDAEMIEPEPGVQENSN